MHKQRFDFKYSKNDLIAELSELILEYTDNYILTVGFDTFLKDVIFLQQNNKEKYYDFQEVKISAAKRTADKLLASGSISIFSTDTQNNILESLGNCDPSIKKYIEDKNKNLLSDELSNRDNLADIMRKPMDDRGWSHKVENVISSVSIEVFKQYILEDANFAELCVRFVKFINGFGTPPFVHARDNILSALEEIVASEVDYQQEKANAILLKLKDPS